MVDLLYYSAPLIAVGGIAGWIYPDQPAAVLSAQAMFVVLEALGIGVGAVLRCRSGRARNGRPNP
jgi:hypothetical protein